MTRRSILSLSLSLAVLSPLFLSCGPKRGASSLTAGTLVVYPSPPQTVRIQFLTRIGTSRDVTGKGSSFWQKLIGETENSGKPIEKPYGIAIHKAKIYVCDTKVGGIDVLDLEARTFDYFKPRGLGQLRKPVNCAVDKFNGELYVADPSRGQVVVFDENGNYVASFAEGEGARPTDVVVDTDRVWVADLGLKKIRVYSKVDYRLLVSFPDVEPEDSSYLRLPVNLWVTQQRVYVSDFGSSAVKVFSQDGEHLMSIGSYGRKPGQFARPKGVAVDRDENLYVVDAAFENVQVFDREGKLLMWFGGGYQGPGDMWLPAQVIIDYDNLEYFQEYVHSSFDLKYLIFVTNQFGPDKVSVYGYVGPTGGSASTN